MLTPAVETLSTCSSQVLNTQSTMKSRITNPSLILISVACAIIFIAGCASTETAKTTSLLSAAGFYTRTPQTAKQKELYAELPSNKIERAKAKGKVFYVFPSNSCRWLTTHSSIRSVSSSTSRSHQKR